MIYTFGDCTFDTTGYTLDRAGKQTRLRPKVFQVLHYLLTQRDRVVSKQELRDTVWPEQFVGDETIDSTVSAVRRAVGDSGRAQRVIQTFPGHGYRFVATIETQDETPTDDVAQAPPTASALMPPTSRKQSPQRRARPPALGRDHDSGNRRPLVSPFVGRSTYLTWCEHALRDASLGRPTAMFLQGEAGMGKTRLVKEIQDIADRRGLQLYAGRCSEDLALPYMPFISALRDPWRQLASELAPDLGSDAQLIDQWLQLATIPSASDNALPSDDGEQAKLRLFLAVGRMITMLAQRQPMLLVIDDLHWADLVSLELYAHLVFTLADVSQNEAAPLLLIGTHRSVPPQDRLARALARFQREEICEFLELEGLDEAEIHLLLEGLGLGRTSQQLIHTLHEVTSGNPLFIQELLQYLQQRKALRRQAGYLMTTASPAELRLPDQVTGAILSRVEALSEDCRQTLIVASMLGDAFSLDILSALSDKSMEDVLFRLEEALHQGLLQSEGQTFYFAHSLMRHVLYHYPSVAQRQRLHWQIAQTLEHLDGAESHDQTLQVAHHLFRAGPIAAADKVVQYARRAGDYAFAMLDWQDASHYYELVLTTAGSSQTLPTPDLANLHFRAGIAYARDGNVSLSDAHFDHATEAYRSLGDVHGQAQALTEKMLREASDAYGKLLDPQPFEQLLEELNEDQLKLRGSLAISLSELYWAGFQQEQAESYAHYALDIGQQIEAHELCARACFNLALAKLQDLQIRPGLEQYQNALDFARRAGDAWLECWVLQRMSTALLFAGQFEDVRAMAQAAHEATSRANNWGHYGLVLAALTMLALSTGAFEAAESYAQEAIKSTARYRFVFGASMALPAQACAHALCGAHQEAASAIEMLVEPGSVFEQPAPLYLTMAQVYRQLTQQYVTGVECTDRTLEALLDAPQLERCDNISLSLLCALIELNVGEPGSAKTTRLYHKLMTVADQGVYFSRGGALGHSDTP